MALFGIVGSAKRDIDKSIAPNVQKFNWPTIAEGEHGTLHAQINEVNGYRFIHMVLKGDPKIKTPKGCLITFHTANGAVDCMSDTREIESYYSNELQLGLTEFDFLPDAELKKQLKNGISSFTLKLKKKEYTFEMKDQNRFKALLK